MAARAACGAQGDARVGPGQGRRRHPVQRAFGIDDGEAVFHHACRMGLEGIVEAEGSSPYRSGRSPDWLKMKNPARKAVRREAEEDWGR